MINLNTGKSTIKKACISNKNEIVTLLRQERGAFPFISTIVIEEFINRAELLIAEDGSGTFGFVRYHHRKDGVTTLHEISVAKEDRRRGIGRKLIKTLLYECAQRGQKVLILKCPVDLPANGFYGRLGFTRIGIEEGKRRLLAVWEKSLVLGQQDLDDKFVFFVTLTNHLKAIRDVIQLWKEAGLPYNPFKHVIFTPLFSSLGTRAEIRKLKDKYDSIVIFDSGGYQVQMGKATYEELFDRLLRLYRENNWADWFVLPDHVPYSTDSDREVEFKVRESLNFARLFVRMMPAGFEDQAVGVIHGRTEDQVRRCVEAYTDMGVRYLGFGSFGTSGSDGAVNLISKKSLRLLSLAQMLARKSGQRLHIFGIGSPRYLIRLANAGINPTSFDSAGWWKAAGFGNVFFPRGRQLHITAMATFETTMSGLKLEKKRSGHECAFCSDLLLLRRNRMRRVLHNLTAMVETIQQLRGE